MLDPRAPVSNQFFALTLWLLGGLIVLGAEPTDVASVGIKGHYRVGRWTGIRYVGSERVQTIETRDGDGVQVQFQQARNINESKWGYAIPGSEAAPLLLKGENGTVLSSRFPAEGSPSRGPSMIPLRMPWIVVLGDPLGVDQIGANKLLNRDASIAVSIPDRATDLPDSVLGYEGVDMMMINAKSVDLLQSLDSQRRAAIQAWIEHGGHLFLTLGESSEDMFQAAPWLQSMLSLDKIVTTKMDPSSVETYTSTQTPLNPFIGIQLPKDRGRVMLMGRTTRRVSIPIAVDYNTGLGRITVMAADLENEMFAAWPERLDLLTQLTGGILIPQQQDASATNRSTAYNDLAGQLRATLDQFEIKRQFGFSIVSLILMALIAAVGPLDYLLVNRFLGRPLLGWLSFPLMAVGLSVVLAYQSRPHAEASPPTVSHANNKDLRCNRFEVVDIDASARVGRGFKVSYLYSHEATLVDFHVTESESLKGISESMQQRLLAPFGHPGESFGGIQIAIEDGRLPSYAVPLQRHSDNADDASSLDSSILKAPIASRSSKGIATQLQFTPKLVDDVVMQRRSGSELLQGELVNPLPFDVLDGMLVYRNWAYLLPTRFPAGGRISRVDSLRQKNFRWQLSRQQALESSTATEAWDPTAIDSIQRVAEMLMFHRAVGGSRYTGLNDEPLSFMDLSHVLSEDRCLLVGKVADEFTTLKTTIGEIEEEPAGDSLTMIRVVLPVISKQDR